MGNQGFKSSYGLGGRWGHPTVTLQDDLNSASFVSMSVNAGNLALVDTTGTIVITSTAAPWDYVPSVGDKIALDGFTGYSGTYILTAVTDNTITFTATTAGNETISSDVDLVRYLPTPVKNYQDVAFSSGVPCYKKIAYSATATADLTLTSQGGVYSYLTVINTMDKDIEVEIAGGKLYVIAGGALGHEIRPFHGNVYCNPKSIDTPTTGNVVINIS